MCHTWNQHLQTKKHSEGKDFLPLTAHIQQETLTCCSMTSDVLTEDLLHVHYWWRLYTLMRTVLHTRGFENVTLMA